LKGEKPPERKRRKTLDVGGESGSGDEGESAGGNGDVDVRGGRRIRKRSRWRRGWCW
jgi:hypothetical protein